MEKKIIFILLLLIFIPFISADTIENYSVKSSVPLGQDTTAFGLFQDDANIHGNILCSFYLLDMDGVLIDRADDQYTDSLGYFMSKFNINEPNFKRDSNYNLKTICGSASQDANFVVGQRESISHLGGQEFDYFTSPENTDTAFIWGIFILIFLVVAFVGYNIFKFARGH